MGLATVIIKAGGTIEHTDDKPQTDLNALHPEAIQALAGLILKS